MTLRGLSIDAVRIARLAAWQPASKDNGTGGDTRSRGSTGYISEAVLAATGEQYPECRCEELGLRAGVLITDMISLGAGCTGSQHLGRPGWVCPRLDKIRRTYHR